MIKTAVDRYTSPPSALPTMGVQRAATNAKSNNSMKPSKILDVFPSDRH